MAVPTWKKQRNAQGMYTYSQEEIKKEVADNTVICTENMNVRWKKKTCRYLRETFDSCCILEKVVPSHFYQTGFS